MRLHILTSVLLVAGLALGALPRDARAETELALRVSGQSLSDGGYGALSTRTGLTELELGAARPLLRPWRGVVWAELGYRLGHPGATPFEGAFSSSAYFQEGTLGARFELPIWSWLVPEVRAGVGLLVARMSWSDNQAPVASDWSTTFAAYALGGVELLLPRRWIEDTGRFNAGLAIEGGWAFAGDLGFVLTPDTPDDGHVHTPSRSTRFGALNLSGPALHIGALVRF